MSLEATYILIDNSECMRNGDYLPTRFEGQSDAVNLLANAKTSQNPESTVGLITMAGKRVEVVQTLVQDPTDVLSAMHRVQISGEADLSAGLETAQLALKHRANKNGGQRIVVFLGSPISEDAKALTKVGKKLKKSGIAVDVITLGSELEDDERIKAFIDAVNKGGSSHLVHVPSGVGMIADMLVSSPIFFGDMGGDEGGDGQAAGGGGGGGGGAMMGVDPNVDPELYEAIQMSLREQQQREADAAATSDAAAAATASSGTSGGGASAEPATPANSNTAAETPNAPSQRPGGVAPMDMGDDDMDQEMRDAIALSLQMGAGGDDAPADGGGGGDDEAAALQMSLALAAQSEKEDEVKNALQNEDYVKSLFGDLPVDLDDASIQAALQSITKGGGKDDEGKESDAKKKKKDDDADKK